MCCRTFASVNPPFFATIMLLLPDASPLLTAAIPSGATILISLPLPKPLATNQESAVEAKIQALALHRLYRLIACAVLPEQVLVLVQSGPTPFQALLNLLRARLAQKIQHLIAPTSTDHVPAFTATVIPDARMGNAPLIKTHSPYDLPRLALHPTPVAMAA